ncbi:hypothetical protein [Bacillus mycoides]|uniref:Uncharacterized protein n=1 Tax=Bacillus mycoides TaxID=1405 RepID=A0ABC9QU91_BACMY|nr:hypothetical protein [Bacillus mycoides]EJR28788.1 hypothetical protein III_06063 [Bacillus mycoides]
MLTDDKPSIFGFLALCLVLCVSIFSVISIIHWFESSIQQNAKEHEELLIKGNHIESFVVDKHYDSGLGLDIPESYSIKLYVNDYLKTLEVSESEYSSIEVGKKVKVIEYKDRVVLDN